MIAVHHVQSEQADDEDVEFYDCSAAVSRAGRISI